MENESLGKGAEQLAAIGVRDFMKRFFVCIGNIPSQILFSIEITPLLPSSET
jgi:hypothetical protein